MSWLLAVLSGSLLILSFPPHGIWPLAFVALVPLISAAVRAPELAQGVQLGCRRRVDLLPNGSNLDESRLWGHGHRLLVHFCPLAGLVRRIRSGCLSSVGHGVDDHLCRSDLMDGR